MIDQNQNYLAKPHAVFETLAECEKTRDYLARRKDVSFGICKTVSRE